MILSVSVLDGFKTAIRSKLTGFGAHLIVSKHDSNYSFETSPIDKNSKTIKELSEIKGVKNVQTFSLKAGIIKTETETQGIILKGIGGDFDWSFFDANMIRGRHFKATKGNSTGKEIVISESLSKITDLDTGDFIHMYFIEDQTRMRKYKIVGIYSTGLSEFDELYILADIHDVEKLNNWNYNENEQISGYEIIIDNFKKLDIIYTEVLKKVGFKFDENGQKLKVMTIKDLYPQIFDWLGLLDMNAIVLLVIMFIIASINMITALLIIILERTRMIGILKSMGENNKSIRKIFIYNGIFILMKGLFWGNLIAIALILFQYFTHILHLNPAIYYVDYVPLQINFVKILLINIGMIILTFLVLIGPSMVVSKIEPVKAIKFD